MPKRIDSQKLPWIPERKAFGRRKDNSKFYNGRKWRKVATSYRKNNPVCVVCASEDVVGPADVCDHIDGYDRIVAEGRDPYSVSELQSLCHYHHNKKSGREASRKG